MTESTVRASALLLAAVISAGNVAATQAIARHQVAVAEAASARNAAALRRFGEHSASIAFMKAAWR